MRLSSLLVFGCLMVFFPWDASSGGILEKLLQGEAMVVDLAYPLNSKNAYWPGEGYSGFKFESMATHETHGVFSGRYSTPEHLGTHIDAPNHFAKGQTAVHEIPLEKLLGPAAVIDITHKTNHDTDYTLSKKDVQEWEKTYGQIPKGAIVLLYTGWSSRWDDYEKYKNADNSGRMHFPGFSKEVAEFFAFERDINGVGIDTLSVDAGISSDFPAHRILNGKGKYLLENLANLDKLPPQGATLIIAPIKIEGGSGGQARVWAVLP